MIKVETAGPGVFLGLWLDEDLLREEFEAIIAAEYPAPRPPRTTSPMRCWRRARSSSRQWLPGKPRATSATPVGGAEDPGRERSPPDAPLKRRAADEREVLNRASTEISFDYPHSTWRRRQASLPPAHPRFATLRSLYRLGSNSGVVRLNPWRGGSRLARSAADHRCAFVSGLA